MIEKLTMGKIRQQSAFLPHDTPVKFVRNVNARNSQPLNELAINCWPGTLEGERCFVIELAELKENPKSSNIPGPSVSGAVQCRRCKGWGWTIDEYTSPTTGLCRNCSTDPLGLGGPCPAAGTVISPSGVTSEILCRLEKGHSGSHISSTDCQWLNYENFKVSTAQASTLAADLRGFSELYPNLRQHSNVLADLVAILKKHAETLKGQ